MLRSHAQETGDSPITAQNSCPTVPGGFTFNSEIQFLPNKTHKTHKGHENYLRLLMVHQPNVKKYRYWYWGYWPRIYLVSDRYQII